jgi:cytochrome bd ubiquinol oxidase subunit I
MDTLFLSRLQFALTAGFHFLFPPISIGLAWILVMLEWRGWRRHDADSLRIAKFFAKIFALTFAVGVATGIVMEFEFGTNWSRYSTFVGDIFGAPLAAEGVFAFFLESGFLGLYLFGRHRVSKGTHWFSILMVAFGATLSAFWIIAANSWQQTPAGYILQNGRAELTDFWAAVFNPSTMIRYLHTVVSCFVMGAFFVAGISAHLILKNRQVTAAKKALRVSVFFGLISAILVAFPLGHEHAKQVAATQPEKFAAIEGLYTSRDGAPLVMFAYPVNRPPALKAPIEIPGLLSWMAFGDVNARIRGINEFPASDIPPLWLTFVSFHNMVLIGGFLILVMLIAAYLVWKEKITENRKVLRLLVLSIPFPMAAIQLGWIAAEVGRQPWIVYHLLRTKDAFSQVVTTGEVVFSFVLFGVIYSALFALYMFLLLKKIKAGPEPLVSEEAA